MYVLLVWWLREGSVDVKVVFKCFLIMVVLVIVFVGVLILVLVGLFGMFDWQFGFQVLVIEIMDDIIWFNNFIFVIIMVIMLFVLVFLVICMVKFSVKNNLVFLCIMYNIMIEVVWMVVLILIFVIIVILFFCLLYKEMEIFEYDMIVKVIGYQWYWGYEYIDDNMNVLYFDFYMVGDVMDVVVDFQVWIEFVEVCGFMFDEVLCLLIVDYELVVLVDIIICF